jgi:hypothetical protein
MSIKKGWQFPSFSAWQGLINETFGQKDDALTGLFNIYLIVTDY